MLNILLVHFSMTQNALGRVSCSGTPHIWCSSSYGAPQANSDAWSGFNDTPWCACTSHNHGFNRRYIHVWSWFWLAIISLSQPIVVLQIMYGQNRGSISCSKSYWCLKVVEDQMLDQMIKVRLPWQERYTGTVHLNTKIFCISLIMKENASSFNIFPGLEVTPTLSDHCLRY